MNEQQQYEKHLAEKFQQLPLPDVEPNWQQMKSLLDKKMPRGGAYWKWITGIGIILIMLFGGTWIITSQDEPVIANKRPNGNSSDKKKEMGAVDSPAEPSLSKKDGLRQQQNSPPLREIKEDNNLNPSPNELSNKTTTIDETLRNESNTSNKRSSSIPGKQTRKLLTGKPGPDSRTTEGKGDHPSAGIINDKSGVGPEVRRDPYVNAQSQTRLNMPDQRREVPAEELGVKTPSIFETRNVELDINVLKAAPDSINQRYYTSLFPEKALVPEQATVSDKKQGKAKSQKSKDILAVEGRTLALGFSLPLGFPLGDQKPGAYNINARPNVMSDFLPVPHMQYHVNSKLYLQTELQLMNPQYIQPVLLYQHKQEVQNTNMVYYNSVYARKLYYFNIPVGIHYSPFPHFYLGTGLQFSSLVSGVALHEQTSTTIGSTRYNLMSQQYAKFKNDSLSRRIDNNEFRLMLDANYYWRQFTVGLRYNQALSNYVSLRLNSTSPLFQDKNKSLQFYLRYNLWENHKRPSLVKPKK